MRREPPNREWHAWFAWFPVRIEQGYKVWLEIIQRRWYEGYDHCGYWIYRLPITEAAADWPEKKPKRIMWDKDKMSVVAMDDIEPGDLVHWGWDEEE